MDAEMYGMGVPLEIMMRTWILIFTSPILPPTVFRNQGKQDICRPGAILGTGRRLCPWYCPVHYGLGNLFSRMMNNDTLDLFIANGFVASAIDRRIQARVDHLLLGGKTTNLKMLVPKVA